MELVAANYTDHSDRFALGLIIEQPGFEFLVKPNEDSSKEIRYRPNLRGTMGLAASAFGYSAAYLFQTDQTRNEEIKKGETSYDDIRLSTFFGSRKQWRVSAYYTRYAGFYIENSNYVDSSVGPDDPLVQRPDLKFRNGGLSVMHIIDSKSYSVSSFTDFAHQQTSSGGSWLAKLDWDHTTFNARSAIVPSSVQGDYGADASLTEGDFDTLSLSGGYGHSFVFNNFFFSPMAMLGLGVQRRSYTLNGTDENSIHNSRKVMASANLGYNGESFYSSFQINFDQIQFETGSLYLNTNLEAYRLTIGSRF